MVRVEYEAGLGAAVMHQLEALFNLDYHLAVLRARTGDPRYREWLKRRPAEGSDEARSLGLAVKPLEALATSLGKLDDRHLRHALGTSASAIAIAHRAKDKELKLWSALGQQLPQFKRRWLDLEADLKKLEPAEAYLTAAFTSGCNVSNVRCDFSFDSFEVTTISVSFDVNRPIRDFVKSYDPRMWHIEAPECFRVSARIADADCTKLIPGSTKAPPPPQLPSPQQAKAEAGKPGRFRLYENAVTAAGGGGASVPALADFRNVLSIAYCVVPKSGESAEPAEIRLTYALSEAITMSVTGTATAGGLDVDSGHACITRLSDSAVHIEASKSVRIARPPWLRDWLNFNMAAILPFWFLNLVLLGACRNQGA